MKVILFCQNAYAFGIMKPISDILKKEGYSYIWYINPKLKELFPFNNDSVTQSIQELNKFNSDAIICPGNEVPHYLKGVKVQIFHGLAGEKKGHFRIRHYFDLYLTQGPYFTDGFNKLQQKHKNFKVEETGWSKLDTYVSIKNIAQQEKENILTKHKASKLLLYAPTFSPSLTSAGDFLNEIKTLANNKEYVIHLKFHDLMAKEHIDNYKKLANSFNNIHYIEERDIVKQLVMADLLISDTSSVIYEFLLLDKPVITYNNINTQIRWNNISDAKELEKAVVENLSIDKFAHQRSEVIANYHPYTDGKSSIRIINSIKNYIKQNGVPTKRKLPLLRRWKINKHFNKNS